MELCHICFDVIDYCQGHGNETCDCVCEHGCLCGECDFEKALISVPYPDEADDDPEVWQDWYDDVMYTYYAFVDGYPSEEYYAELLK